MKFYLNIDRYLVGLPISIQTNAFRTQVTDSYIG